MIRQGSSRYLGTSKPTAVSPDSPESVKLLDRALSQGGQPAFIVIVQAEYYELVEELLQKCPEMAGTKHNDPNGTGFENLCNASSWLGRPKVMDLAMSCCACLHTPKFAMQAIGGAIVSHNRFGFGDDYYRLIETQLKYLKDEEALPAAIQDDSFLPNHKMAKDYLWPDHYGYGESCLSVESMIELTELLIRLDLMIYTELLTTVRHPCRWLKIARTMRA